MKIKTIVAVSAALSLTACLPAITWKTLITDADLTGTILPVATDSGSNTYQLFPIGTQVFLRKLDPKGIELWRMNVDESVADSLTFADPQLRVSPQGAVVGYHDKVTRQAFLKQYDPDGTVIWSTDFGTHASEALRDMVVGADGSLTTVLRLSSTRTSVQRYDSSGLAGPETLLQNGLFICVGGCDVTVAVNGTGETLVNLADIDATLSYLIDANGILLWNKSRETNVLAGYTSTPVTASTNGFVSTHPGATWEYDLAGTETWSKPFGSIAQPAMDANGNIYVLDSNFASTFLYPITPKVHKLASDGTPLLEIPLVDQYKANQIAWREDFQRLITLSNYYTVGPEVDFTITKESGQTLSVFDVAGTKMQSYKSKPVQEKVPVCTPMPDCLTYTVIPGEAWSRFAIATNRRIVVSGLIVDSERFAKAYRLP